MRKTLVVGLAITLWACQAGPPVGSTTPTPAPVTTATTTLSPTVVPTAAGPTSAPSATQVPGGPFAIEAVGYAFFAPSVATAGPTIMSFANNGTETHAAQLARLKPGTTVESFLAEFTFGEARALAMVELPGGPNGIVPGATTEVYLDLPTGEYLMYCPVPTPGGRPHFALGMFSAFTVEAGDNGTTAPVPDGEIILRDMSFELPEDTSAGVHHWRVTNEGPSIHEVQLFKLHEGASLEDLTAAIAGATPPSGFPADDAGGFAFTSPGASGSFTIDLSPGTYAALCFVWDPATSRYHFMLGMAATFAVA